MKIYGRGANYLKWDKLVLQTPVSHILSHIWIWGHKSKRETIGEGELFPNGYRMGDKIKVSYMHVWKCHNEKSYFVQIKYANKNESKKSSIVFLYEI
jgi:hypothetical protein